MNPPNFVQKLAQNHCLSVILSRVNTNSPQKKQLLQCIIVYKKLRNIELNSKRVVARPKVRLYEHNVVNFEHDILKGLNNNFEGFKQFLTHWELQQHIC